MRKPVFSIVILIAFVASGQKVDRDRVEMSPDRQAAVKNAEEFARKEATPGTPKFSEVFLGALELAMRPDASASLLPTPSRRRQIAGAGYRGMQFDTRFNANLSDMLGGDKTEKVYGGEPAPKGSYPDVVAVLGNGLICTGTLIAPQVVLTAAHCEHDGINTEVVFGEDVRVDSRRVSIKSSKALIGPNDSLAAGDLALMFLESPVTDVPIRRIARAGWIDAAKSVRIVGFGKTEDPQGKPLGTKNVVDVPVASASCSGKVKFISGDRDDDDYYGCGRGKELVAGAYKLNKDSCGGDSGGPALVKGPDGAWYLAAAVSRAIEWPKMMRECGDGGIYARVDSSLQWLLFEKVPYEIGAIASATTPMTARLTTTRPALVRPAGAAVRTARVTGEITTADGLPQLITDSGDAIELKNADRVSEEFGGIPIAATVELNNGASSINDVTLKVVEEWKKSGTLAGALAQPFANIERIATAMSAQRATIAELRESVAAARRSAAKLVATEPQHSAEHPRYVATYRGLTRTLKAINGRNDRYVPLAYKQIYENSRGAIALAMRNEPKAFCSGVLVAPDVVLTADHCLKNRDARDIEVRFSWEVDLRGVQLPHETFVLDDVIARGRPVNGGSRLDFALLKLKRNAGGDLPSPKWPIQCLSSRRLRVDEPLYIVGHSQGNFMEVHDFTFVRFPFEIDRDERDELRDLAAAEFYDSPDRDQFLRDFDSSYQPYAAGGSEMFRHYAVRWEGQPTVAMDSDTFEGDSGAPVYHRVTNRVVALFFAGEKGEYYDAGYRRYEAAIPIGEVIAQLEQQFPGWSQDERVCVDQ